MKQRPRIYYSATQRALIWERWRKGETIHQIAGLFDRGHSSIQRILAESGGIRPSRAAAFEIGIDVERTRRDFPWLSSRKLDPLDRGLARTSALFDQPRDPTQWRSGRLSSRSSRPGSLGSGASAQGL